MAVPRRPSTPRSTVIAAIGAALSLGCLMTQWNIDGGRRVDFRIYYRAISSIGGRGLYNYGVGDNLGFTYPPFAAVLLRPITWLPETASSKVWLILSILLAGAIFWATLRIISADQAVGRAAGNTLGNSVGNTARTTAATYRPIIVALALWTYPLLYSFRLGQINPLVVGLLALDVALIHRNRPAGIGTGLAAALKVTPLAMVVFLACSRRRADAARAIAAFVGASLLAAIVLPAETRIYWTEKLFDTKRVGHVTGGHNASLKSVVLEIIPGGALPSVIWALGAGALVVIAAVRVRRSIDTDPLGAYTVGMCCSYAVSPITWTHHHWFTVIAMMIWMIRASGPVQWTIAGVGAVGLLNPFGLDEGSMITATMIVAFAIVTIVALPLQLAPAPGAEDQAPELSGPTTTPALADSVA